MLFLKDLNIFHIDGKEIPCITASHAPNARSPGAPGSLYMDTSTGCLYICTAADTLQEAYSWKMVCDVDPETVQNAISDYLTQHPIAGSGISGVAVELLITILQNAVFTTNQTANIAALQEALASGANSGGTDEDSGGNGGNDAVADNIAVVDGVMTIVTVGSAIDVSDDVMTIA